MSNKYRVFIIDEAHMITPDAFNALLKTLEEPPTSVIFILATTNVEKVPKTVQSRCVILNFAKAKDADIVTMLKRIAKKENIEADESLLAFIAQHSDQSFRDASKLLEELNMQNKLTIDEAQQVLGLMGRQDLLEVMSQKDLAGALAWIEEFQLAGGSFKSLIEHLLRELRFLLLAKNGVVEIEGKMPDFTVSDISQLMKLFTQAYSNLKITPIESIALEIAVADFYNGRNSKVKS